FVTAVYLDLAGRKPSTSELAAGIRQIQRFDRASWALELIDHEVDVHRRSVAERFSELLNRPPSPGEDDTEASLLAPAEYRALQSSRWGRACRSRVASSKRVNR